MSRTEVSDTEQAAIDAIGAVVDVANCERLEPPDTSRHRTGGCGWLMGGSLM